LVPHIPSSYGTLEPLTVHVPEGTVLNARYPAPVQNRAVLAMCLPDVIQTAFAQCIPDRVTTGGCTRWAIHVESSASGVTRFDSLFQAGGMGAGQDSHGPSAKFFPIRAVHTPVEHFERA